MTLLQLARYKGMTIQAVCEEIKRVTGYELPCTRNVNVVDSIIKKVAPAYFNRRVNTEASFERITEKSDLEKGKAKMSQNARKSETHKEIDFFTSDEDEIITIVHKEMSDCVILNFLTGGTLMLQKSNFNRKTVIHKGDIVGLKFLDSPDYNADERFKICYILPKLQWQKTKIEKAYNEKEVILGRILYPFKDQGFFVNIYGIQAIMFNNQISENTQLYEGAKVNVAISSAEVEGTKFRVSVSQKWAESLSKQKEKRGYAKAVKDDYESIHVDEHLDTIIDKIDKNYIIVKYNNLPGIIYRSDLFWCNVKNINDHVSEGNTIKVKVVEKNIDDKGRFNVRFSHKECLPNPWKELIFEEFQMVDGPVIRVEDRGVLIKIGEGIEGFLHIKDMTKMEYEALKQWQPTDGNVNVSIKAVNASQKPISLTTHQDSYEIENKWNSIIQNYEVNKVYHAKVIMHDDTFLWVQLEEGIEASIHKNELSWSRTQGNNLDSYQINDDVTILIKNIDSNKRLIKASIKALLPNPWEAASVSLKTGDICNVEVIEKKENILIVETLDSFKLIGNIKMSEISWSPLRPEDEPQVRWKMPAKIMIFHPVISVIASHFRPL